MPSPYPPSPDEPSTPFPITPAQAAAANGLGVERLAAPVPNRGVGPQFDPPPLLPPPPRGGAGQPQQRRDTSFRPAMPPLEDAYFKQRGLRGDGGSLPAPPLHGLPGNERGAAAGPGGALAGFPPIPGVVGGGWPQPRQQEQQQPQDYSRAPLPPQQQAQQQWESRGGWAPHGGGGPPVLPPHPSGALPEQQPPHEGGARSPHEAEGRPKHRHHHRAEEEPEDTSVTFGDGPRRLPHFPDAPDDVAQALGRHGRHRAPDEHVHGERKVEGENQHEEMKPKSKDKRGHHHLPPNDADSGLPPQRDGGVHGGGHKHHSHHKHKASQREDDGEESRHHHRHHHRHSHHQHHSRGEDDGEQERRKPVPAGDSSLGRVWESPHAKSSLEKLRSFEGGGGGGGGGSGGAYPVYHPDALGRGHVSAHKEPALRYSESIGGARYHNPLQDARVPVGAPPVPPPAAPAKINDWPIEVQPPAQFFVDPSVIV